MAGPWDALGRGIQGGVDAYLAGRLRREEAGREAAMQKLREEQLALERLQVRQGMDRWETEQSLAEKYRAEERHGMLDPRSTEPGIHIPMFQEISPGAFVPIPQAERDRMYTEQRTAYEAYQGELAKEEHGRRLEEIEYGARMAHKYSYPPSHIEATAKEQPNFFLPSGEVNPADAYSFLQSWIERMGLNPATNPNALNLFLDDIARLYPQIPNARERARLWYLQQQPPAPPAPKPEREGPGFVQRLIDLIPGEPKWGAAQAGAAAPAAAPAPAQPLPAADPVRTQIEQMIRSAHPDLPQDMLQVLIEEEYKKYLRSQPSGFPQAAGAMRGALNMPSAAPSGPLTPQQQAAEAMRRGWGGR